MLFFTSNLCKISIVHAHMCVCSLKLKCENYWSIQRHQAFCYTTNDLSPLSPFTPSFTKSEVDWALGTCQGSARQVGMVVNKPEAAPGLLKFRSHLCARVVPLPRIVDIIPFAHLPSSVLPLQPIQGLALRRCSINESSTLTPASF